MRVLNIYYGIHSCLFGFCLIAVTDRGLCKLAFFDQPAEKNALVDELQQEWYKAIIHNDEQKTHSYFKQIFLKQDNEKKPIHLLLKATPFKLQVWQALLNISPGQLATYSHIAESLNNPKAVRAVASAIANNPIAYLIPCHRVIRNTGAFKRIPLGER